MSLFVLTVAVNGHGTEVDWYFDRKDQFDQALGLVKEKVAAGASLEYGSRTDFASDFSEFRDWLDASL